MQTVFIGPSPERSCGDIAAKAAVKAWCRWFQTDEAITDIPAAKKLANEIGYQF